MSSKLLDRYSDYTAYLLQGTSLRFHFNVIVYSAKFSHTYLTMPLHKPMQWFPTLKVECFNIHWGCGWAPYSGGFMSPVSPVFHTVVTVSIGLKNTFIHLE